MALRSRTRHPLRRTFVAVALGALFVPAVADAKTKTPVVSKITPKIASVGTKITITGKNFRRGKAKNSVLFRRDKGKALFVKADVSTTKQLTVIVPKALEKYMLMTGSVVQPTRFRVRVLAAKLSKAYTSAKLSPVIGPERAAGGGASGGGGVPTAPDGDCDADGVKNNVDLDDDNDLLDDALELTLMLDPCSGDTDGDGVTDGYEYKSAVDLNRGNAAVSVPYPGSRPYPNPLDGKDGDTDHDGDVMTLREEFTVWADPRYGNKSSVLNYSDGKQTTVAETAPNAADRLTPSVIWANDPTMRFLDADHDQAISASELLVLDFNRNGTVSASEFTYQDFNGDNILSDDERDPDADGLSNYDEQHGRMTAGYWAGVYDSEKPYTAWVAFAEPDWLNPDTDGDGIVDGIDDQDYDTFLNVAELSRDAAQTSGSAPWSAYGRVNPLNPCLPAQTLAFTDLATGSLTTLLSPTCMRHPPIGSGPAPYDDSPGYPSYDVLD